MNNVQVSLNSTQELNFKPEIIALEFFGEIPSYIQLNDLEIPLEFIQKIMLNSTALYKAYENIDYKFVDHISNFGSIVDKFVVVTKACDKFQDSKWSGTDNDVVLSFNLTSEPIKILTSKKQVFTDSSMIIYYNANKTSEAQIQELLLEIFKPGNCIIDDTEIIDNNSYINLVVKSASGSLTTKEFAIKDPKINLGLNYGQEFKDIDKQIFKGLKKSDKGIWIFHGPAGTGKSMYVRNLIKRLNGLDKVQEVIYMPSEMLGALESPDFIPFIQDYRDSVIIIEDADIALQTRKSHGSIVKTVLQLTDGILADCLKLKIIATFNCDLSQIDDALLRKGRLQYRHEFRLLSRKEALDLAIGLKMDPKLFETPDFKDKQYWSLAEIYNIKQDFYWDKNTKKIGF